MTIEEFVKKAKEQDSRNYITCESRFKPELLSDDFESFLDIIRIK